ncbi:hypothetical protein FDP41_013631 [Naegleria fowleri]|uniref:ABC transporter domain-containing protein n=1 Tax=Naegleria fowleri TaxID=5763 RepID=A0A6A5BTA4_NAEFO|nr:uncharacterized protein FDP41_013631 [Naegleria fowleri]KAF0980417.1 hypothetical protein FDP41_013631 [Naegleria fowleri]
MSSLISEIREKKRFTYKLTYCTELLWNWFSVRCGLVREVTTSLIILAIFLYYYNYYDANFDEQNTDQSKNNEKLIPIQVVIALFYQRMKNLIDSSETLFYTFTKTATSFRPVQRILNFVKQLPLEPNHGTRSISEKPKDLGFQGTIVFDRVSMKYSPESKNALDNISFSIKQGAKCGIVGRTGSGKSSIFNCILLLQEIENNEGAIYIDGTDIRELPIRDLRKSITYIPQQPILFMGTLRENMDFEGEFSDEEITQALEQVGFLQALKEKSNSSITVKGEELSILDIKIT